MDFEDLPNARYVDCKYCKFENKGKCMCYAKLTNNIVKTGSQNFVDPFLINLGMECEFFCIISGKEQIYKDMYNEKKFREVWK